MEGAQGNGQLDSFSWAQSVKLSVKVGIVIAATGTFALVLRRFPRATVAATVGIASFVYFTGQTSKVQSTVQRLDQMIERLLQGEREAPLQNPDLEHVKRCFGTECESAALLVGGLSGSRNYKVRVLGQDYVLRLLKPESQLDTWEHEIVAATYAGEREIGPRVHYASEDAMIMDFVAGPTLSASMLQNRDQLKKLLAVVRTLHQSQGEFPKGWTLFERIRKQLEQLLQSDTPHPVAAVVHAIEGLKEVEELFQNDPQVPCHHDLSALNVIFDGENFKVIDWTDSGLGSCYGDLGYFVLVNDISPERFPEVLELYLDRPATDGEVALLQLMRKQNCLRIFASNFHAHEQSVAKTQQREARSNELAQYLENPNLPSLDHFFKLHAAGELKGKEMIIQLSLAALKEYLAP